MHHNVFFRQEEMQQPVVIKTIMEVHLEELSLFPSFLAETCTADILASSLETESGVLD